MKITSALNYRAQVVELLTAEKLPVEDLPADLHHFLVALDETGAVAGVIGLEIYEGKGLLRSLAVAQKLRGKGIAASLISALEEHATLNSVTALYLLTETAPRYFTTKDFTTITRQDVPEEVKQSSEFRHVCPASAIVMHKSLSSTTMISKKILFVCIHNSARSQMAEAFVNQLANGYLTAESAGLEPGKLNPNVVEVMQEAGIDISQKSTQGVFDLLKQDRHFDAVITVCDAASAEACPVFPGKAKRLGWSFTDPSAFTGTRAEILEQTRKVRDEIKETVVEFIAQAKDVNYWTN